MSELRLWQRLLDLNDDVNEAVSMDGGHERHTAWWRWHDSTFPSKIHLFVSAWSSSRRRRKTWQYQKHAKLARSLCLEMFTCHQLLIVSCVTKESSRALLKNVSVRRVRQLAARTWRQAVWVGGSHLGQRHSGGRGWTESQLSSQFALLVSHLVTTASTNLAATVIQGSDLFLFVTRAYVPTLECNVLLRGLVHCHRGNKTEPNVTW